MPCAALGRTAPSIWQPHAGQTHLPSSPGIFHHQVGLGKRRWQSGQTTRRIDSLSRITETIATQASTAAAIHAFMAVAPFDKAVRGTCKDGEKRFAPTKLP